MPVAVGANYGQKDTKDQKIQLSLLNSQEQKLGTGRAPCTQHHHTGGQTTSATPPARPHIRNQLTPPSPQGASKGNLLVFSPSPAAAGAPIKPSLNFLSGLRSISIDWGRPRTLVSITWSYHPLLHIPPSSPATSVNPTYFQTPLDSEPFQPAHCVHANSLSLPVIFCSLHYNLRSTNTGIFALFINTCIPSAKGGDGHLEGPITTK